jgi:hypothetical protein
MSTAQAAALRSHLQTLCDNGAAIGAFPDVGDLISTWGATPNDTAKLVGLVREHCPAGYFVPYVCNHTNMRVIMAKGNGQNFTLGLLATMASIKYCRTRLKRIARNFRKMAAGFPNGSGFRAGVEAFCQQLEALTAPSPAPGLGGLLPMAMQSLPALATRAPRAERNLLTTQAAEYAA